MSGLATFRVIVGPTGSGKSSLLHVLSGLERLTSGTATWPGIGGPDDIALVFQPTVSSPWTR
ncbi:ATP-binding cassette domain-containing protein [Streptomyces sp. NPDC056704]|uniref:ATP-binding cassette domain-containing protein n=1 Tax=Streptomyces sp. NPDC056704 TaxID=3345917 RepID=UPI00367EEEAB